MGGVGAWCAAGTAERPRAPGEEGGGECAGAVEPLARAAAAGELGGGDDRGGAGRGGAPRGRLPVAGPARRSINQATFQSLRGRPAPPRAAGDRTGRTGGPPARLQPDRGAVVRAVRAARRGNGRRSRTAETVLQPLGERARALPVVPATGRADRIESGCGESLGRDARRGGGHYRAPTIRAANA